jgi:hypothetical protein
LRGLHAPSRSQSDQPSSSAPHPTRLLPRAKGRTAARRGERVERAVEPGRWAIFIGRRTATDGLGASGGIARSSHRAPKRLGGEALPADPLARSADPGLVRAECPRVRATSETRGVLRPQSGPRALLTVLCVAAQRPGEVQLRELSRVPSWRHCRSHCVCAGVTCGGFIML